MILFLRNILNVCCYLVARIRFVPKYTTNYVRVHNKNFKPYAIIHSYNVPLFSLVLIYFVAVSCSCHKWEKNELYVRDFKIPYFMEPQFRQFRQFLSMKVVIQLPSNKMLINIFQRRCLLFQPGCNIRSLKVLRVFGEIVLWYKVTKSNLTFFLETVWNKRHCLSKYL